MTVNDSDENGILKYLIKNKIKILTMDSNNAKKYEITTIHKLSSNIL